MADVISIRITNLPQIRAAFKQAPGAMVKELNGAIKKTVFSIQKGEFKQYQALGIRYITGGLYGSILRGTYYGHLTGEVGPDARGHVPVKYSKYVHDGTKFMKKRPFLLNAVNSGSSDVNGFFQDAVQNVLDDIGRKV